MREDTIKDHILVALARIFRTILYTNPIGTGWFGKFKKRSDDGDVTLKFGRPVAMGLKKGSADLIGFLPVVITKEMVGKKIPVFVSLEIKKPGKEPEPDQEDWLRTMLLHKCCAGVAHSEDEAVKIVQDYLDNLRR